MSKIEDIKKELNIRYYINESFYPKYTMGIDIPSIDYEVEAIMEFLKKINYKPSLDNIYHIMKGKKNIMEYYSLNKNNIIIQDYLNQILSQIKPVGGIISPESLFAGGLLFFSLIAMKFFGAFFEESGKILARKLFDNEKHKAMEILQMTENEINYFEREYLSLSTKGPDFQIIIDSIKKIKE